MQPFSVDRLPDGFASDVHDKPAGFHKLLQVHAANLGRRHDSVKVKSLI
jgi:hypothetical protein